MFGIVGSFFAHKSNALTVSLGFMTEQYPTKVKYHTCILSFRVQNNKTLLQKGNTISSMIAHISFHIKNIIITSLSTGLLPIKHTHTKKEISRYASGITVLLKVSRR